MMPTAIGPGEQEQDEPDDDAEEEGQADAHLEASPQARRVAPRRRRPRRTG